MFFINIDMFSFSFVVFKGIYETYRLDIVNYFFLSVISLTGNTSVVKSSTCYIFYKIIIKTTVSQNQIKTFKHFLMAPIDN